MYYFASTGVGNFVSRGHSAHYVESITTE